MMTKQSGNKEHKQTKYTKRKDNPMRNKSKL